MLVTRRASPGSLLSSGSTIERIHACMQARRHVLHDPVARSQALTSTMPATNTSNQRDCVCTSAVAAAPAVVAQRIGSCPTVFGRREAKQF